MSVSSRENTKGKGIKAVEGLGVGVFYYYSEVLDQHEKNSDKVIDDKQAVVVAEMLDTEAGGDKQKLKSILSAKTRFKSPRNGAFVTVDYEGDGDLWILA